MQKFLDSLIWGILLFLFLPTVAIVASWNSLPGDSLFGVKLAMERTLLVLASPSQEVKGTLQMKYTERRFAEAKKLLTNRNSIEGLTYLNRQVVDAKTTILATSDSATKKQLAQKYITTLRTVSSELEVQKQTIAAAPNPSAQPVVQPPPTRVSNPTVTPAPSIRTLPTPTPTPAPIFVPPATTPTPTPTTPSADVGGAIDDSQQEIDDTIKDLERAASTQSELMHDRNQERQESRGNENNGREDSNRGGNQENRGAR